MLALQRELAAESQSSQSAAVGGAVTASCTLLSQERLIRKAAGLAHFLTNEVAVAPVSPALGHPPPPPGIGG